MNFWLMLTSAQRNIVSITSTKSNEEITHPIMIPIFNFGQFVEYSLLDNLIYIHLKYANKRALMFS